MCIFDRRAKTIAVRVPLNVLPGKNVVSQPPLENIQTRQNHVRNTLCQVLKHGDEPSNCESLHPCYYSLIEGLGLHVFNIKHYIIRIIIKKHIYIIKSKSNGITRNMNRYTPKDYRKLPIIYSKPYLLISPTPYL